MRTIIIPDRITFPAEGSSEGSCSFGEFLGQVIWPSKSWLEDEAWSGAAMGLLAKFGACEAGSNIVITDEEHEKLHAVLKSATYRPELAQYLMPFVHAIVAAKRK